MIKYSSDDAVFRKILPSRADSLALTPPLLSVTRGIISDMRICFTSAHVLPPTSPKLLLEHCAFKEHPIQYLIMVQGLRGSTHGSIIRRTSITSPYIFRA